MHGQNHIKLILLSDATQSEYPTVFLYKNIFQQ